MAVGLTSCTVTPADPSTGKYATQYPQTTLEYSIYINKQITVFVNELSTRLNQAVHSTDGVYENETEATEQSIQLLLDGKQMYIEYECGNHTQTNFNGKCNKMLNFTNTLNFIVPNRKGEEIINSQVRKWIDNKGIEALNYVKIRVTSAAIIKDVNLLEDSSWHFVYNLSKREIPEVN